MQGVDLTRSAFSEGLPVQNQRSVVSANGTKTDILCQTFTDRHFVLVTQFGKMGTLIQATSEDKGDGGKIYKVDVLLGKRDDPLLLVYARQIIEKISTVSNKPLLLGIGLKPDTRDAETFQSVLNTLIEIATW